MEIDKKDFDINIDNINIEEIMNHIRENIKKRGYEIEELEREYDFTPDDSEKIELENSLNLLLNSWNINLEKDLVQTSGLLSKIKGIFRRSLRKLVRPYIKPIMEEQLAINAYLTRIVDILYKQNVQIMSNLEKKEKEEEFSMDYLAFENKYRGSEENIKELQSKFLKYFDGKDNILDIGCGRGEFLSLLLENDKKNVLGLDLNKQMILKCLKNNLPVKLYDGIKYLDENNNLKLGGIFSSQVIEHLKPSQIIKFIKGAYKNLEEDGVLIMETINPMTLFPYTMAYPLDLTHRQLVHPFTIEVLLKEHGFKNIEFIYSSYNDPEIPILKIDNADENHLSEYNKKIEKIHEILFGYQDYAVIAWK